MSLASPILPVDDGPRAVTGPSASDLRRQIGRLKAVPTLPRMVERVVAALEDPAVDFKNVAELIEIDQSLTAQVLRLANSAFYSVQGKVSQVSQALLVLGTTVTRSVALSTGVFDLRGVGLAGFWEHSLGCAVAAGAIAKVTDLASPEEVTAAGLLHDLGKVILFTEIPEAFDRVASHGHRQGLEFRLAERDLLGVDHGEVASWLVERWRFPACLADPIIWHHDPGRARNATRETDIVHVANSLVRALGVGSGGDDRIPAIDRGAWSRLELTPDKLDRVLDAFEADLDHALNYAVRD